VIVEYLMGDNVSIVSQYNWPTQF